MTTFGSRLSTCNRVLQKERLLTYGVISPGQSRGISPLQGVGVVTTTAPYNKAVANAIAADGVMGWWSGRGGGGWGPSISASPILRVHPFSTLLKPPS